MNRLEAAAGASLIALIAVGAGLKYQELSRLADTPAPLAHVPPRLQHETRPERTVDAAIAAYVSGVEAAEGAEKNAQLGSLLASLESPQFDGERLDHVTGETLARAIVSALESGVDDPELRRRAAGFLAARVPGRTSREFVFKTLEEGPVEAREAALKGVGSPLGVRGASVYAKVKELGERGLVPDSLLPSALRRTGGIKAKDPLIELMNSTDSVRLIAACAVSLQDFRDPELIGTILERLEAVGMIESAGKLPWLSPALLDEHLKSADKAGLRRGMMAMATRPSLVKTGIVHAETALQSPDPDTRRFAAVAVKKAVVSEFIDAQRGEALLAGRLQVETEPVLKAELTGGLERIHRLLGHRETGVQ